MGTYLALRDLARRELGAEIAEHLDGDADVALDQAPQGIVAHPPVEQPHRRDAQPLLVDLGRVRRVRARDPAAHVGLVRGAARERDALPVHEHRLEHEDVGQVHPALERVVEHEDVAFAHFVVVVGEHRGERGRHRAEVHGQREALRDHVPARVGHGRGEIHVVPQHPGVGGAAHGHRHLVRGREERVLEQLEIDRIDVVGHGAPRVAARVRPTLEGAPARPAPNRACEHNANGPNVPIGRAEVSLGACASHPRRDAGSRLSLGACASRPQVGRRPTIAASGWTPAIPDPPSRRRRDAPSHRYRRRPRAACSRWFVSSSAQAFRALSRRKSDSARRRAPALR